MSEQVAKILVVSEDRELIEELTIRLASLSGGYEVSSSCEYRRIMAAMSTGQYDVYFVDQSIFSGDGLQLIHAGREQGSDAAYVLICRDECLDHEEILSVGATAYIRIDEIVKSLGYVLEFAITSNATWRSARKQEKYMRALSQSQPMGMLLIADDMTVKMANNFAKHMGGFKGDVVQKTQHSQATILGDVIGCKYRSECKGRCRDFNNKDVCQLAAIVQEVFTSDASSLCREMELAFSGDSYDSKMWARVSVKPVYIDGRKHAVVAIDDLTVRHEMEQLLEKAQTQAREDQKKMSEVNEQLKQIVSQTNEMVQEAFAASNAKSNFMANVSHELRTPLNGIQGFCQLLLEDELTESQRDYAQTILGCTKDLIKVLNNVLDFTRLEKNAISMTRSWFDIEDITEDLVVLFKNAAQEKGLDFKVDIDPCCPQEICSDQSKLKQILINIIDNAVKYTKSGSVEIQVSSVEVEDDVYVCFDVRDTGIGMSLETSSKIFESFSQADSSATRKYDGLGLGLTVAKRYVELLGGKIEVDSSEGEGSRFSVVVPVDRKIKRIRLADRAKTVRESRGVLVAESQHCQGEIISRYLSQMAVKADVVLNGEDALERLMSYGYNYVLLDMSMPELCDESVLEVIQEVTQIMPVVALCQERDKRVAELCRRIGIKDILIRPVEKAKLDALTIAYCKVSQEVIDANLDLDAQDFFTNIGDNSLASLTEAGSAHNAAPIHSSLSDDPDMQDVIDSFLVMLPDYIRALGQAVESGTMKDVISVAFDFRDSAGTAGYKELRLLVLTLEKAAQANDPEAVRQIYQNIPGVVNRILIAGEKV